MGTWFYPDDALSLKSSEVTSNRITYEVRALTCVLREEVE